MVKYIERTEGVLKEEKVYGDRAVAYLHGDRFEQRWLRAFVCRLPFVSYLYGWLQKMPWTKKKVARFIQDFEVDVEEFILDVQQFRSFNDFFVRELKSEARPICKEGACLPADARYRFYQDISQVDGFVVKGEKFSLERLLGDPVLAKRYERGAMGIARLCPSDYHRFHFPCAGIPSAPKRIKGKWYSVNPISLKKNIHVMTENKRIVTSLLTEKFGEVLIVAVGATNVGSIHTTYQPGKQVKKGEEMGFFSFGGSALVLLFEPGRIQFDEDLVAVTKKGLEVRALFGTSMGLSITP